MDKDGQTLQVDWLDRWVRRNLEDFQLNRIVLFFFLSPSYLCVKKSGKGSGEREKGETDRQTKIHRETENVNLYMSSLRDYSLKGIIDVLMDLKSDEVQRFVKKMVNV